MDVFLRALLVFLFVLYRKIPLYFHLRTAGQLLIAWLFPRPLTRIDEEEIANECCWLGDLDFNMVRPTVAKWAVLERATTTMHARTGACRVLAAHVHGSERTWHLVPKLALSSLPLSALLLISPAHE